MPSLPDHRRLSTGLGLFSLGLGAAQLAAPGALNRLTGLRDTDTHRRWQRVVGVQELSAAAGLLGPGPTTRWLWGRTAGDVLPSTMFAGAAGGRGSHPGRTAATLASLAGCMGADALTSVLATRASGEREADEQEAPADVPSGPTRGTAAITIAGSRQTVMQGWRAFEEQAEGDARLGPLEITEGTPGGSLTFRTTSDASVQASGEATFADAPHGRGTEIHLALTWSAPAGPVGSAVQKLTGNEPLQAARDDLRRFKQLVEVGEVVRSDGTPAGPSARLQPKQRPAQPVEA